MFAVPDRKAVEQVQVQEAGKMAEEVGKMAEEVGKMAEEVGMLAVGQEVDMRTAEEEAGMSEQAPVHEGQTGSQF